MRHLKKGRKFHREINQRKALFKSLGSNLILKEHIIITEPRAKELKRFIEKKITIAKRGNIAAIRNLRKYFSEKIVQKLVKEISPSLKERKGGYTRLTKIGRRATDRARMVKIELVK
ncbi:MAG: 50S ribosomal protein L17 [Parcubacteria group bacterium CG_4_9_14_0_2_um_filter_35_11]|nr:MAG: 50S ribosomal protein L17 [Parcubacteria group bacterium CG07_land_8_20_14_0_80_35_11]PJC48126.1 MAG: 50S ribosomal protein L17 [Parcubacteria group bacterium CG_4_9_14_0_2_um_filter_35_11]